jgi:hypothetical protein
MLPSSKATRMASRAGPASGPASGPAASGPANRRANNANNGANGGGRGGGGGGAQGPSIQSRLTEDTFANFLHGFVEVAASDLLDARGGRVRYVIETVDDRGRVRERQYRLGGWLTRVDPTLRYLRLVNPYAKRSWSVQLAPPGKRVRLYYMAPGTSDEISTLRNLLTQLENGEIRITRVP